MIGSCKKNLSMIVSSTTSPVSRDPANVPVVSRMDASALAPLTAWDGEWMERGIENLSLPFYPWVAKRTSLYRVIFLFHPGYLR